MRPREELVTIAHNAVAQESTLRQKHSAKIVSSIGLTLTLLERREGTVSRLKWIPALLQTYLHTELCWVGAIEKWQTEA